MAVRKRGRVWYYDFMIKGIRYREAVPEARNKAQAEQAETHARHAVFQGKYGRPTGTHSLAQFAKDVYLPWAKANKNSWKSDVCHVQAICDYFGSKSFREVTPMLVEKYKKDRRQSKTVRDGERSPATVNKELQCLSKIFNMAIDNGYAESNPCRKVKKLRTDGQRNRYLLPDEETKLLGFFTDRRAHLRPITIVALNTGMRRGEILGLKRGCVDVQRNVIYVTKTKTGKARTVPMNARVKDELVALMDSAPDSEYVFVNPRTGKRLTDIKNAFVSACEDADIEDFHFHDLRHTAATRMADAGVDAFTIAEILGHATLHMTKRYTHALDQNKRRAVETLDGYAENNCLKFVTNKERQAV